MDRVGQPRQRANRKERIIVATARGSGRLVRNAWRTGSLDTQIHSVHPYKKRVCFVSTDRQEIIEFLVDHYEHPRNRGPLPDADIHLTGGNPGCSDKVEMYARVNPDGHIEQVTFEGEGCTISMAAASYVTEMV